MTGGAGELGWAGVTAISQGALFSMANVACLENKSTNVRFNEVFLNYRVDFDAVAEQKGASGIIKSSEFARVYESVLANKNIEGCRVSINSPDDVENLKFVRKLADST